MTGRPRRLVQVWWSLAAVGTASLGLALTWCAQHCDRAALHCVRKSIAAGAPPLAAAHARDPP